MSTSIKPERSLTSNGHSSASTDDLSSLLKPSPRKKRKIMAGAVGGMLGILFLLGIFKYVQIHRETKARENFRLPPATVTSIVAHKEDWISNLSAVGSLQAVNGVMVSADLPGIVDSIHFESGSEVKQGDLLIKLDTRQEEAELIAAKARQDLAGYNLQRAQELYAKNVSARSEYDSAVATFEETVGNVQEIETKIARKTIRAPFSGLLGIRQVNVGQYLQGGNKIVPLQSLDPIYANFSLPQSNLAQLQKSKQVFIQAENSDNRTYEGMITALDSVVDNLTANIKVQATIPNKERLLRPGMFIYADVRLPNKQKVITVPVSAINYAPYGDSVFVIQPAKSEKLTLEVQQRLVTLGATRGDRVVIESGLVEGEQVATSRVFNLRSGMPVQINNNVQPSNKLDPQPVDN